MKIEKNQIAKEGKNKPLYLHDLKAIATKLTTSTLRLIHPDRCKTYVLNIKGSVEPVAEVLVLKDGMRMLGVDKDELLNQIQNIPTVDKQMLNTRQKKVMNKHKRHNFNIGDKIIEADIAKGQSTLYNFKCSFLSEAKKLRDAFTNLAPGDHTMKNLLAEANVYYKDEYKTNNFCGIGFHGDAERPRSPVIGCNVGADRYLCFRAFHKNRYFNDCETRIHLQHGDIYFMSEHAVGCNWKKSSQVVYRHRAGSLKFLAKDDKDRARRWYLADKKANRNRRERERREKESRGPSLMEELREELREKESRGPSPKKRKAEVVEVTDYTEEVTRDGKKYKKCVSYVPMVDLT